MRLPADAPTRDKILFLLKTKGPLSAAQLGERLHVTAMAARQHLQKLETEELVSWTESLNKAGQQKVGRPLRRWLLTVKGGARFPDNHADLSVELINAVRSSFGEAGLEKLIRERTRAQIERYRGSIEPRASLAERVTALCRQRSAEGYMAESRRGRDGSMTLIENHCPICAAATSCQGLCAQELELFTEVLGKGVKVERSEHILAGARRCAYRITELP